MPAPVRASRNLDGTIEVSREAGRRAGAGSQVGSNAPVDLAGKHPVERRERICPSTGVPLSGIFEAQRMVSTRCL